MKLTVGQVGQERTRWQTVLTVLAAGKQDNKEIIRHYASAYGKINELTTEEVEQVVDKVYHQLNDKAPR